MVKKLDVNFIEGMDALAAVEALGLILTGGAGAPMIWRGPFILTP